MFSNFHDCNDDNAVSKLGKNTEGKLFIVFDKDDNGLESDLTHQLTITEIPSSFDDSELGQFKQFLAVFISNVVLNVDCSNGKKIEDVCLISNEDRGGHSFFIEGRNGDGWYLGKCCEPLGLNIPNYLST